METRTAMAHASRFMDSSPVTQGARADHRISRSQLIGKSSEDRRLRLQHLPNRVRSLQEIRKRSQQLTTLDLMAFEALFGGANCAQHSNGIHRRFRHHVLARPKRLERSGFKGAERPYGV